MKKSVWILVFLLLSSFVLAQDDEPSIGDSFGSSEDVAKLQEGINKLPIGEDGQANFSAYKPFYSRADERIDKINSWLENNVAWLGPVFHMKPQISWAFLLNVYFILLFLVLLVLNAEGLWFWFDEEKFSRMFGAGLFIVFLITGLYAYLANLILNVLQALWNTLVLGSLWVAIFVVIVSAIVFLFGGGGVLIFVKNFFIQWAKRRKELKAKSEEELNRETLDKIVKGATGGK